MQSRTSFFNGSIFKKSITRFWPIWGTYFAIWFVLVPVVLLANRYDRRPTAVQDFLLNTGFAGGLIMSALFAVFSAMAVWSFLYNTRSAHGTACLPVRREGVFASVTLAGLLPYLAVNAVIAVLALLAEMVIGVAALGATLQMFCLMTLPFLLFYGFATLCAQLTGNILVLPAVYAVLNFVFVGAEVLVRALVGVFVYGMNRDLEAFSLKWLSPFVAILMRCRVTSHSVWTGEYYTYGGSYFAGWHVLIIYAVIGLALLIPALLLYRRRRMETAGDVVAVEVLKPVFRWCMAVGCALCLAALVYVLFWESGAAVNEGGPICLAALIFAMFIGAFLGWFIAEMLMKKSFRVFRCGGGLGGWGGLGLCSLILAGLMLACEFDLFGYEKYIPDPEKVESVTVWCQGSFADLEEPESIQTVTALHKSIVANKALHEAEVFDVRAETVCFNTVKLNYFLRSGRMVSREYDIRYTLTEPGDAGLVQEALNCPEAIADRKRTEFPITEDAIYDSGITSFMTAADCAAAAGYGSAEEYILREYCGVSGSELEALDEQTRRVMVTEAALSNAVYGWELEKYYYNAYSAYTPATASDMPVPTTAPAPVATGLGISAEGLDLDVENMLFRYEWSFTPRQMMELYETCILPDIADNTLGRVWIVEDEEYRREVYSTEIYISARTEQIEVAAANKVYEDVPYEAAVPDPFIYEHFNTTPTVDSVRTNAWLEAHGVKQCTLAEQEEYLRALTDGLPGWEER